MRRRVGPPLVMLTLLVLLGPLYSSYATVPVGDEFRMRVIDPKTGQGVPNVRVESDNGIVCHTRANGEIVWTEEVLMGRNVRFSIDRSDRHERDNVTLHVNRGGAIDIALRKERDLQD